ncbi:outer membrane beta-barrel family protein [Ancylomarina euxinus]|nr:outer membrane beta-barrel family protein [Ancylomarina euxinus]MCZ4694902.1 outer membrane beta-barrel family protein [Ancylomarina euxinus]
MKRLIPLLIILLLGTTTFANNSTNKFGVINGTIKDIKSNEAIEYATVSVFSKDKSKLIDGTITNENGFFEINKLKPGNYYIEVSFIGYEKKIIPDIAIRSYQKMMNLDIIKLNYSTKALHEVVVNSDNHAIDYQIDKKVIPVGSQLSAAGGTAIDVLGTAPSVSVDVNGNVSLRGSTNFKVLIDGRPTIRSAQEVLSQIPTNQIENIEIITNPSAKFDAEGEAGIINIISKKFTLKGSSGFINITPGSHDNRAGSAMFNLKKQKSNFNLGANYTQKAYSGERNNYQTLFTEPYTFINSSGELDYKRNIYKFSTAYDFEIDSLNSFFITAEIGRSDLDKKDDLTYDTFQTGSSHFFEESLEQIDTRTDHYVTTFNYLRKFNKKGHHLNTFIDYSGRNWKKIVLNNSEITGQSNTYHSFIEEEAKGVVISSDYTLPLAGKSKFEAGYKFLSFEFNTDRDFKVKNIIDPDFSQNSDYNKTMHSLYSTYFGKVNKLSYQIGLRAEHINRENIYAGNKYKVNRWDLFPSIHTQMDVGKVSELSASYSRRIKRPSSSLLEGFEIWNDSHNRTKGNPNLKPELIHSFELNFSTKLGKHSLSFDSYYRSKKGKTERIKTISDDNSSIVITSYENVGEDHTVGLESFASLAISKWWKNLLLVDVSHYKIDGEYWDSSNLNNIEKHDFSTSSTNYTLRSISNFHLSKITQLQLDLEYNSKSKWAQGENGDSFLATSTLKHSFFKRKLSASFIVRDILNTANLKKTYYNNDFSLINKFKQKAPTFKISLSYKINNYKSIRRAKGADIGQM